MAARVHDARRISNCSTVVARARRDHSGPAGRPVPHSLSKAKKRTARLERAGGQIAFNLQTETCPFERRSSDSARTKACGTKVFSSPIRAPLGPPVALGTIEGISSARSTAGASLGSLDRFNHTRDLTFDAVRIVEIHTPAFAPGLRPAVFSLATASAGS